jgi:Protein of unknown function (DUF3667)
MRELDALGEVVTGAALARSVEPGTGQLWDGHSTEKACLNCGTPLVGSYCYACGQQARVVRTLGAFAQDFLTGALNIEGKIFKSLPLLAWRPGELTRRYIDGQRARFVSPLALFLFCVFLLFAAIQFAGGAGMNNVSVGDQVYHSTDEAIGGVQAKIAKLQRKRAKADADDTAEIDQSLAEQNKQLQALLRIKQLGITNAVLANAKENGSSTEIPILKEAVAKAKANPQLALYKLQDAASKFAWLLIPISVPFMWLLFPFSRRFKLYDHSVFVTYSLSFMMLLAAALTLCGNVGGPIVPLLAVFVPPIHMYRQLRGTYGIGRFGALWRLTLLLTFALTAFSLFAVAVVLLGISG